MDFQLSDQPPPTTLRVSEMFYSIQGEGPTAGHPAVFLRLQGCDFKCAYCDTVEVHSKGTLYTFDRLLKEFNDNGFVTALMQGARLVITGGNPMLQQEAIAEFVPLLASYCGMLLPVLPVEIETQGNVLPIPSLVSIVSQWNVSPKLVASNVPHRKRYRPEVIEFLSNQPNSYFKFVVRDGQDVEEAVKQYILPHSLKSKQVYLMPMCSSKEQHEDVSAEIVYFCKHYGFRFSPRLQLVVYNQATGV